MNGASLIQTLRTGKRVYGIGIEGFGQPRWPRFFASLGLDFVFLDSEHTPNSRETIAWALQAYAAQNVAPLLRIPEASGTQAAMALDAGAHGVVAPYVETIDQVKEIVGAVKYRPLKGQALQTLLEEGRFPNQETAAYLEAYNQNAVVVIMIESPLGVANLPSLLAIGGVDVVLIGPHDLSVSHGLPEQYDHPKIQQGMRQIINTCREHTVGVGAHIVGGPLERERAWAEWGCNFICHRTDTVMIARNIQGELAQLKIALGDAPADANLDQVGVGGHAW